MELNHKLENLKKNLGRRKVRVAIIGLGSVGNYLLNYIFSSNHEVEVFVLGRSREKMQSDVNVARVAADIRYQKLTPCKILEVDLNRVDQISEVLGSIQPDFIVNSSRAYAHIKYGSISWGTVRAYGIWSPLSVKYVKNIMKACEALPVQPIVINTSYSDAVNAWIKSAGGAYPDFGSGNLNHLLPRIRFAIASEYKIEDYQNLEISIATSHFHDVVISKEGKTEGLNPLLKVKYKGNELKIDESRVYSLCAIPMPTDAKRNMMNASSNFEIISKILRALTLDETVRVHVPGAMGKVGGFPVLTRGAGARPTAEIDQTDFSLEKMEDMNRKSIYFDGIENVKDGLLFYTDPLIEKVKSAFDFQLPKSISLADSDLLAQDLITYVIEKRK